jgi:hypothetical protein
MDGTFANQAQKRQKNRGGKRPAKNRRLVAPT